MERERYRDDAAAVGDGVNPDSIGLGGADLNEEIRFLKSERSANREDRYDFQFKRSPFWGR